METVRRSGEFRIYKAAHFENDIRLFYDEEAGKLWWLAGDVLKALKYSTIGSSMVYQKDGDRRKVRYGGKNRLLVSNGGLDTFLERYTKDCVLFRNTV